MMKSTKAKQNHGKNKKNNPNHNFVKSQVGDINKRFYDNFLESYFFIKVSNLYSLLNSSDDERKKIYDLRIDKLEISGEYKPSENAVEKYVITEIVMTMFQCMETYLRMYMAHSALTGCPNLILADLTIKDYQKNVKNIAMGKFNTMNTKYTDDELITITFYASEENIQQLASKWNKTVEYVIEQNKKYLQYAASFVLDNSEYNSFKHGMYVSQENSGFSWGDENKGLSKQGDALVYIGKTRHSDGQLQWTKIVKWVDIKLYATLILVFNLYLDTLLQFWEDILVKKSEQIKLILPHDLDEIKKNHGESGVRLRNRNSEEDLQGLQESLFITSLKFPYSYYREE